MATMHAVVGADRHDTAFLLPTLTEIKTRVVDNNHQNYDTALAITTLGLARPEALGS